MINTSCPSPNFNDRPGGKAPDTVVLHYTGMKNFADALDRLTSPESKVSCHYLLDMNGDAYSLVDEEKRAWHAGVSNWAGRANVNDFSIGIELHNPGHQYGYIPYPDEQMNALLKLMEGIFSRHNIRVRDVVAHSDIAPARKEDPGELFNWKMLADNGFAIWPGAEYSVKSGGRIIARAGDDNGYIGIVQKKLSDFGYHLDITSQMDVATIQVITAFRRRFTPQYLHPIWDEYAEFILSDMLGRTKFFGAA